MQMKLKDLNFEVKSFSIKKTKLNNKPNLFKKRKERQLNHFSTIGSFFQ